jgi:lysozyme family protein
MSNEPAKSIFARCCAFTFPEEGGNFADPRGGPTNLGVRQIELDEFRRRNGLGPMKVAALERDGATSIYYVDYYWRAHCDELGDWRLAVVMFDAAVNCGVNAATRLLQVALGLTLIDGEFGPATEAALANQQMAQGADHFTPLVLDCLRGRDRYYHAIKDPRFTKGWLERVDDLAEYVGLAAEWGKDRDSSRGSHARE